jgi:formylglycine-generating enzyme required for sulfatase activity
MRTIGSVSFAAIVAVAVVASAAGAREPATVPLRGGAFEMGALPGTSGYRLETIPHTVVLAPFAIARREVTNAEYAAFLDATVRSRDELAQDLAVDASPGLRVTGPGRVAPVDGREDEPVTGATWDGARAYAHWLSQETGKAYALPSEAQWEYAARTAAATPGTAIVGMPGALWEWTDDCFDLRFYLHAPTRDPRVIDPRCATPVIRGGPLADEGGRGSAAMRADAFAAGNPTIGFRVMHADDGGARNAVGPPPPLVPPPHGAASADRSVAITLDPPRTALPIAVAAVFDLPEERRAVALAFRGTTRIGGLPPGPLRIAFSTTVADGGFERTVVVPPHGTLRLRFGAAELLPRRISAPLRGVLRRPDGTPVAGATVVYDAYPARVETRTAADGSFTVASAEKIDAVLFVDVPGASRFTRLLAVSAAGPRRRTFVVSPPTEERRS